jgi:tRNA(Ile2) C34 agmatinyltransferase TiaS
MRQIKEYKNPRCETCGYRRKLNSNGLCSSCVKRAHYKKHKLGMYAT